MELSVNLLGLYGAGAGHRPVSVTEAVQMAADDGFRVYDFPLSDPTFYDGDWRREIDRAMNCAARNGGVFRYAHVPFQFPWNDPSAGNWARFERVMSLAIEGANSLGVRCVALHPYTTNEPAESYDARPCRDAALQHLRPWLEQAAGCGDARSYGEITQVERQSLEGRRPRRPRPLRTAALHTSRQDWCTHRSVSPGLPSSKA